jgi:hypothetical protein
MTKNGRKKYSRNFFKIFFDQKLQFTYVKATGEAFSPQKRTSNTSRNYQLFSMFVGHFCPLRSGFESRDPIESGSNTDPNPQHCLEAKILIDQLLMNTIWIQQYF